MTSTTALTGRNGHATVGGTAIARLTKWSVNPTMASSSQWGDSDSGGYTNRAAGRRDATSDTEGKYDTNSEQWDLFVPGDIVALILYLNSATLYYNFPRALNTDFSLTVDVDTEEVIGWTASWGADGIYYKPGDNP